MNQGVGHKIIYNNSKALRGDLPLNSHDDMLFVKSKIFFFLVFFVFKSAPQIG